MRRMLPSRENPWRSGLWRGQAAREIVALREKCFSSVATTDCGAVGGVLLTPDETWSFEPQFRLLLNHLCEYSAAPFDLFAATDAESPLPSYSVRYVERFIVHSRGSGVDPVPQLALSFARKGTGGLFSRDLEKMICALGREAAHSALRPPPYGPPGGGNPTPRPEEPDSGRLDYRYAPRSAPIALLPSRQLYVQPAMARARVLVLRNLLVLSAVCLLRDIRTRLFGPIHKYVDLVVGVNKGQLVAHDLFVQGLSARESLEKHSNRKPLSRLKPAFTRPENPQAHDKLPGSLQIALQEGSKISTSWGEVVKCPEARDNAALIAAALAASLFYVQTKSVGAADPFSNRRGPDNALLYSDAN
ncbi:hypothetical protein CHU98_g2320 [Xylaria longipes]|nr:hypothetical protein CHU98_g2320 [Xylaria longipes]